MIKTIGKVLLVICFALSVTLVSFVVGQKFQKKTFSAGAPINYPFEQKWFGNDIVSPAPAFQSTLIDIQQIFSTHTSPPDCPDCTTIMVTGDTLTARTVNQKTTSLNNFTWPFEKTAEVLKSADVAITNLETPLVSDCAIKTDGMVFCGNTKSVDGLKFAGFDVINFANNHAGNAGKEGVIETQQLLTQNGFLTTGVQQPVYKTVKGTRFAFLGYNDVEKYGFIADVDDARMVKEISEARANADVVIVQFHWGEEYRYEPTLRQKELAYRSIDLGADLIIGNHPHWIEPVQFYKGKLIMYSHGNFVFDQMWSTETRQGVVGKYVFQGKNLIDVQFLPIFIENYGQPRWMEGSEKQKILDILKRESEKL